MVCFALITSGFILGMARPMREGVTLAFSMCLVVLYRCIIWVHIGFVCVYFEFTLLSSTRWTRNGFKSVHREHKTILNIDWIGSMVAELWRPQNLGQTNGFRKCSFFFWKGGGQVQLNLRKHCNTVKYYQLPLVCWRGYEKLSTHSIAITRAVEGQAWYCDAKCG